MRWKEEEKSHMREIGIKFGGKDALALKPF